MCCMYMYFFAVDNFELDNNILIYHRTQHGYVKYFDILQHLTKSQLIFYIEQNC